MTVRCLKPGCDRTWPRDPVLGGEPHPARDILADKLGKYGPCPSGRCGLERTAAGAQHVIPGAGQDAAGLARRLAAAPLKPSAPQEPCDVGLFGDGVKQLDLVDLVARKP